MTADLAELQTLSFASQKILLQPYTVPPFSKILQHLRDRLPLHHNHLEVVNQTLNIQM